MTRATELSEWLQDAAPEDLMSDWEKVDEICALLLQLEHELAEGRQDAEEQARLNGMGAQRELKLMAELDECRRQAAAVRADIFALPIG